MQRFRMGKSIALIGLVATLLVLCSALPFEPAPKLYRSAPEDVPPWAEQGNFRFIRLDGGQIESWKAERTWWGSKFSVEQKDVLSHIYDRDFEKILGLLKQAESTGSGLLGAAGGSTIRPGANGMYALHLRYAYWTDQSKAFRLRA